MRIRSTVLQLIQTIRYNDKTDVAQLMDAFLQFFTDNVPKRLSITPT